MKKILIVVALVLLAGIAFGQSLQKERIHSGDILFDKTPSKVERGMLFDSTLSQLFQDTLDYKRKSRNIKGVSAAIIIPEQGTWTGVSGVSHDTIKITQDMLFCIGSITKIYTATLILTLAEEGILTLDDSLHSWLPTYDHIDSTITIRQLLNMTSGIYDYITDNPSFASIVLSDLTRLWTPEEILTSLVGAPNFAPGTAFRYSSTNYILLGMIINEATGSMISVEFRNRFLDPLDLNRTYLAGEETLIGEIAQPWIRHWNGSLEDVSVLYDTAMFSLAWTAGNIFSTAEEVAKWVKTLYGGDELNQEYLDQMVTFGPVDIQGWPSELTGYGLGVMKFNILDRELWGHTGIIDGNVSIVAYLPEDSISIAILLNEQFEGTFNEIMRNAIDILELFLSIGLGVEIEIPAPELFAVDPSYQPDFIKAVSTLEGMIYLVPENTNKDLSIIRAKAIDSVTVVANVPVDIPLTSLDNGVYWLYARNNSGKLSEPKDFTIMGVGIYNKKADQISVHPNPTHELLTIEIDQPGHYSIDITSLNGQLISSTTMEGTSHQIDLSSFQKGIYFITIRSQDLVTTKKIIKL